MRYRSLFISDAHLGLKNTQLEKLLDVLKNNEFEYLFLVGDIIDGWKLKRKFEWGELENLFVQKAFRLARKGVKIKYLIGNHCSFLYRFEGESFGGIEIAEKHIHFTAAGKRLLIMHGHQFDGIVRCNKWLQKLGGHLYEYLLNFNVQFNYWRQKCGFGYWSVSKYLKAKTKEAVDYVANFEDSAIDYAKKQGVDGIVMGHVHTPKIRTGEINYYNCGDFTENSTFIVENLDGTIELLEA